MHIVRDKPAIFQFFLHHRMAAVFQDILPIFRDNRLAEIMINCCLPKREQTIQLSDNMGCFQNAGHLFPHSIAQLHKHLILQLFQLFIGTQHPVFQLFQLRCDKPLAVGQRLFAHIFLRHIAAFAAGDIDVVAEYLVVAYF